MSDVERPAVELAEGDRVGRYVVLEELGAGGMGTVYAAYDPELDRRIALKLLLPELAEGDSSAVRKRLIREAQAMARLSHPSVVTVYDVGHLGENVFIAIELITGGNLRQWKEQAQPAWREVLAAYQQAAAGLMAAHESGIVHRDFKPDNVLIDEMGRVRVADFGIAGHIDDHVAAAQESPTVERRITADGEALTVPGTTLGTPGYAAPEQLMGEAVTEQSDQFSFCAALFESLYGIRPFAGDTVFDIIVAVQEGNVAPHPADSAVPPRVHQVIVRGLSAAPGDRYPSMQALLDDLMRDPDGSLAELWNSERRATLRQAFTDVSQDFGEHTWERVHDLIDAYVSSWIAMNQDAWLATHVRREQSTELFDLRMGYLRQCRHELEAVLDLFEGADPSIVNNAVDSVLALSPISDCADVEVLKSGVPLPRDPDQRAQLSELRGTLARIAALRGADRLTEALELAFSAVETAEAIGFSPSQAVAHALLGDLQRRVGDLEEAEESLFRAVCAAEAAHSDREKAKALIDLVYVVGYQQGRSEEGSRWANLANATLQRAGDDPVLRARLVNNMGSICWHDGDYDKASSLNTVSLNIRTRVLGRTHPAVADSLNNLGGVYLRTGRTKEAIENFERARQIFVRALGEAHPNVAVSLVNIAGALSADGQHDEAIEHCQRALRIVMKRFGPEHKRTAATLKTLGSIYLAKGAAGMAVAPLRRALEIGQGRRRDSDPRSGLLRFMLARAMWESSEDRERALALAREARDALSGGGEKYAHASASVDKWLQSVG